VVLRQEKTAVDSPSYRTLFEKREAGESDATATLKQINSHIHVVLYQSPFMMHGSRHLILASETFGIALATKFDSRSP